jgi:hypothetical protein
MGNARAQEGRNGNRSPRPSVQNHGAEAKAEASRICDGEVYVAVECKQVHDDMRDEARTLEEKIFLSNL